MLPYALTFGNESSKEAKHTLKEIQDLILNYKRKHSDKLAVCETCGQHFETYTEREVHQNVWTGKKCKPTWNFDSVAYEKDRAFIETTDKEFMQCYVRVYVHLNLDEYVEHTVGVKKLLLNDLKQDIVWLPSKVLIGDHCQCFIVPIFCVDIILRHIYFAEISSFDLEMWYQAISSCVY
ncbi:hypothetical protein RFI_14038, partial [Reticulomyxa filosa]